MFYFSHSRASLVLNQLLPVLTDSTMQPWDLHHLLQARKELTWVSPAPFPHLSGLGARQASQRPGERLGAALAALGWDI